VAEVQGGDAEVPKVLDDGMRLRKASAGLTALPITGSLHATRRNSMWADFAWQKSNYS